MLTRSRLMSGSPEARTRLPLRPVRKTSRPTISRAMSASLTSWVAWVEMLLPWRSTVTRSETAFTSRSLWVMNRMVRPPASRPSMTPISSSTSGGVRTAVGSSRIKSVASNAKALRISTRCRCPTKRFGSALADPAGNYSGRSVRVPVRPWPARSENRPKRFGWRPRNRLSATVIDGTSVKCWWTMPIPARLAASDPGSDHRRR